MFCKHNWEILDKTILPSPWEQMTKVAEEVEWEHEVQGALRPYLFQKALVLVMQCTLCSRTKKIKCSLFHENFIALR